MKSADNWLNQLSGLPDSPVICVNRQIIKDIQLDAAKRGMEIAATVASEYNLTSRKTAAKAIQTRAQKLTLEDF